MKKIAFVLAAALAVTACGGEKEVYHNDTVVLENASGASAHDGPTQTRQPTLPTPDEGRK